jgi:hypothetical protein
VLAAASRRTSVAGALIPAITSDIRENRQQRKRFRGSDGAKYDYKSKK